MWEFVEKCEGTSKYCIFKCHCGTIRKVCKYDIKYGKSTCCGCDYLIKHIFVDGIECKKCSKCKNIYPITEYRKEKVRSDGLASDCVNCSRLEQNIRTKTRYVKDENFRKKLREYAKKQKYDQKYASIKKQRLLERMQNPVYAKEVRQKNAERQRRKRKENIQFRIASVLRNRIISALKGFYKSKSSLELLGCSVNQAIEWIESQFIDSMTWENYGKYGWHIDHKIPISSFDMNDPDQQKQAFNYKNLQPLWARDNHSKKNRLDWKPLDIESPPVIILKDTTKN